MILDEVDVVKSDHAAKGVDIIWRVVKNVRERKIRMKRKK